MKKRALAFILTGVLCISALTGCSKSDFDGDAVAMTVNGTEITADMANFYSRYIQSQYESYYGAYLGDTIWEAQEDGEKTYENMAKESVQESLRVMVLSEENAKEYDAELTEEDKEVIADSVKAFSEANEQEDKEKVSGDDETVERIMTLMAVQLKVQNAIQAGADTEVSDDEAAQKSMMYVRYSYETYEDDGSTTTVSDDEKAELQKNAKALADAAKDGGDFEKLAEEQEVTANTVSFDASTDTLDAELVKAADALKEGEVSDVIETETACYVVKLVSLFDEEATETKKSEIISERQSELYTSVTEEWTEKAEVEINQEVWDSIDFSTMSLAMPEEETEEDAEDTEESAETETTEDAE